MHRPISASALLPLSSCLDLPRMYFTMLNRLTAVGTTVLINWFIITCFCRRVQYRRYRPEDSRKKERFTPRAVIKTVPERPEKAPVISLLFAYPPIMYNQRIDIPPGTSPDGSGKARSMNI